MELNKKLLIRKKKVGNFYKKRGVHIIIIIKELIVKAPSLQRRKVDAYYANRTICKGMNFF